MIQLDKFRLSLVSALLATTVLGACGSSGGDGDSPPNEDGTNTVGGGTGGTGTNGPDPDGGDGTGDGATGGGAGTGGGDTGSDGATTGGTDGGGGGTSDPLDPVSGQGVTYFGLVDIAQPSPGDGPFGEEEGLVSAVFFGFGAEVPVDRAAAQVAPELENCAVFGADDEIVGGGDVPDADVPDVDVDLVSAGETITFTSPAGTWLTLPRVEQFGFTLYQSEGALPLPVPDGLVLDIPGDRFPAFASVAIPDVTPLTGLSPALDPATPVGADTVFRWDAGRGDPSVYVGIELTAVDTGGGEPSVTSVDCLVADDGEFALPAATRALLGDDFSAIASVSRIGIRAEIRGEALLLVANAAGS